MDAPSGWTKANAGAILLLIAGYFLAARLSLNLSLGNTNATPVWPPSGIAFAALALFGVRLWPGVFLGALAANLAAFATGMGGIALPAAAASAAIATGNTLEAVVGGGFVRRFAGSNPFTGADRSLKFVAWVPVAAFLSASTGTVALRATGMASADIGWDVFRTWWIGDIAGILVVTPLLITLYHAPRTLPPPKAILECSGYLAALVLVAAGIFSQGGGLGGAQPMAYAITPFLILIAFRCGPATAYFGMLLVSAVSILGALRGLGPFSGGSEHSRLLLLQAFAGVVSVTLIFLNASLSDRKRSAEALREANEGLERRVEERTREVVQSELRLRQLSNAGFEGLVIHDMGRILLANQAAADMFGHSVEAFTGKAVTEYLAPESVPAALENMRKRTEQPVISIGVRGDGTRFRIEVRGKPIEYMGKPMRVVAVRDITERLKAEEMRERAVEALESANRAKSDFLATVSHEIRTPLNGIIGMTSALEDTALDPAQGKYVRILRSCGEALLDQVNGILDIAKIESGSMQLETRAFGLDRLLEEALLPHRELARKKGLAFEVEIDGPSGIRAYGDPARLRQVIQNLAGNACKFTAQGAVRVRAMIGIEGGEVALEVRVADTGIGMARSTLDRIFEPFVQGDASMSRRFGGTGLGLAICDRIATLMGGTLEAESRLGTGSEFRFRCRLPEAVEERRPGPAAEPASESKGDGAGGALRILVVEDDPVNQEVARIFLSRLGGSVEIASNGQEAVDLASAGRFDVILMDCQLPGMDGFAATRAIRSRESGSRHVPIVAMTANAVQGDRERCIDSGMDDYLSKPLDASELDRALRKVRARG